MRKLLFILFVCCCVSGFAQQQQGQVTFDFMLGYSPVFNGDLGRYGGLYIPTEQDEYPDYSSHTPNVGVTAEYCIIRRLSLGVAANYQAETISWSYICSDRISRVNLAGRLLFQLNRNKKTKDFSNYIGIRVGDSYYHDNRLGVGQVPYYIFGPNHTQSTFQFLYGLRYYLGGEAFCINLEIGIGDPYFLSGGFGFRINTKKQASTAPASTTPKQ